MKYLFWIGIFIFGCKTLTPEQKVLQNKCEELEAKIKDTWKYDSIEQHYVGNYRFLAELSYNENKYRDCMESKDTTYIIKLLGNHFTLESRDTTKGKYPYQLTYMTSKPCLDVFKHNNTKCSSLIFYFKEGGKIEKVYYLEEGATYHK